MILQQGTKLKEDNNFDEAIKVFEKAKDFIQDTLSPDSMSTEINNIKNLSNEIYSAQIKPIVEEGKKLHEQDSKDEAISKFKEALETTDKMYDSELKNLEISLIAEAINPIYIGRLDPLLEEGKEITNQENFNESVPKINEAVDKFNVPEKPTQLPLRWPIQDVYTIKGVGTVPVGKVECGVMKPGMQL